MSIELLEHLAGRRRAGGRTGVGDIGEGVGQEPGLHRLAAVGQVAGGEDGELDATGLQQLDQLRIAAELGLGADLGGEAAGGFLVQLCGKAFGNLMPDMAGRHDVGQAQVFRLHSGATQDSCHGQCRCSQCLVEQSHDVHLSRCCYGL
ncbi:hypothetical protein D3C86_1648520 [compost metagenome]